MARPPLPALTVKQILAWADAHHARTGRWPGRTSGPVHETAWQTWQAIDWALRAGRRGLPGGTTLFRLLQEMRGIRKPYRSSAGRLKRRRLALRLRARGLTLAEIGARLGVTRQAVFQLLRTRE